jgi:glycosyltransferase involved in cell wall biosynthesis/tetratricopeptide (TPR) repeat protein
VIELSCAIIAKNEAENIDNCLRSVVGHVDEIIVVDTGSTDRTMDVAIKHGAKVYPFDPHTNPDSFFMDDEATCATFGAPPPYSGDVMLGDFGAARRKSFSLARGEYVMWIDADDVLEGGERLRSIVADMRQRNLDMAFLSYDYARDHLGRVFYRQWRERIIKRDCATWVNPVHEVLLPTRPVSNARFEGVNFQHHRKADRKTTPNRNYKILLRQHEADKRNGAAPDPRTLFYLGQEARWIEPVKAAGFYEDYLARSGWGEERAAAHVALGSMCEFGQLPGMTADQAYARADREYAAAAANMPDNPDGLHGLGRIAYLRGRWHDCVSYIERAFSIGNTESMLGANPLDRTYRPHVYYNHALAKIGRIEDAVASCKAGLEACPDDPGVPGGAPGMLRHNLAAYEAELAARKTAQLPKAAPAPVVEFDKNEDVDAPPIANIPRDAMVIWAMQLWKQLAHVEQKATKVIEFLRSLPDSIADDPAITRMRLATNRRFVSEDGTNGTADAIDLTRHDRKRKDPSVDYDGSVGCVSDRKFIVFYIGPGPEKWNSTTPNTTGIGGSETAAIEMAKNLAAMGHHVDVYADPERAATFDGVNYIPHGAFRAPDCDVFIASRTPWSIEQFGEVKAKVKLLWVHDIHCGQPTPDMERWLLKFDRVLCLSEWHKGFFLSCYPTLHPDRVVVTRNGIDPARFQLFEAAKEAANLGLHFTQDPLQKHNHLVFSSSPNRGLETLVLNFPHIKQRVPDAQLHVYYGFDTWLTFAKARGDANEVAQIDAFQRFLAERSHHGSGIFIHGKVSQVELANALMRAKVRPHWTAFTETSCISAMEAMAAGCVPVHSGVAALAETVKHGVTVPLDQPQKFVDECVRLLTDEDYRRPIANEGRKYALESLSWSSLAKEWVDMFGRVEQELRADPLPRWVEVKAS